MKVVSFIEDRRVVERLLRHLNLLAELSRGPPSDDFVYQPSYDDLPVVERGRRLPPVLGARRAFGNRPLLPQNRCPPKSSKGVRASVKSPRESPRKLLTAF
jgi:hypothetical protein